MLGYLRRWIPWPHRKLSFYGRTDTGLVRGNNEDTFCILSDRQVFLVADGMGGHQAGEVASRLAVESLVEYFSKAAIRKRLGSHTALRRLLLEGIQHANQVVMKRAAARQELRGMGCTLVAGLVDRRTLHICHVGDTRCYMASKRGLSQITTDHSLATSRPEKTDGLGRAPERHVLTMAIGFPLPQDPEYHAVPFARGDRLLLCTDGLWSMVENRQLYRTVQEASSPEAACDSLVRQANEAGGKDNITALVVFG